MISNALDTVSSDIYSDCQRFLFELIQNADDAASGNENEMQLGDEMADILFVLICLANQTGVDLTKAFEQNLLKKTNRDKDRHQNNEKLHQ